MPEVYSLAVILVIYVIGGVNDKSHHYHHHLRIKSGMAFFGKCFHIHAERQHPASLPKVSIAGASEQGQEIHQPLWQTFPGYSGDLDKIYRPFLQPAI